jgi:hypothetical protein
MSEKNGSPRVVLSEADLRAIQESLADLICSLCGQKYRDHRERLITSSNTPRISTLMRQTKSPVSGEQLCQPHS